MADGARHDFLDDQWGASNFKKVVGLGASLATKLQKAVNGRERHCKELEELTAAFDPETIKSWQKMIEEWNLDPLGHPDPYQELGQGKFLLSHCSLALIAPV